MSKPTTVAELIAALSKLDPETHVLEERIDIIYGRVLFPAKFGWPVEKRAECWPSYIESDEGEPSIIL